MASKAKHPHIDNASEEQLNALLEKKDPEIRAIYLNAHRLFLECLPDVKYSTDCVDGQTGYGVRQYGYDGWGLGALSAHTKWVSLGFHAWNRPRGSRGITGGNGQEGTAR